MRTNAAHDTLPAVALQQHRLPALLCSAVSQTYRDELGSGHPVPDMMNSMSHGQNLSSTSGEPEFVL